MLSVRRLGMSSWRPFSLVIDGAFLSPQNRQQWGRGRPGGRAPCRQPEPAPVFLGNSSSVSLVLSGHKASSLRSGRGCPGRVTEGFGSRWSSHTMSTDLGAGAGLQCGDGRFRSTQPQSGPGQSTHSTCHLRAVTRSPGSQGVYMNSRALSPGAGKRIPTPPSSPQPLITIIHGNPFNYRCRR